MKAVNFANIDGIIDNCVVFYESRAVKGIVRLVGVNSRVVGLFVTVIYRVRAECAMVDGIMTREYGKRSGTNLMTSLSITSTVLYAMYVLLLCCVVVSCRVVSDGVLKRWKKLAMVEAG
jgi:hypothetical protein